MVVLAVVSVLCFVVAMWAATTWLPPLAEGSVGTLAYFVVCGLAGAVFAIIGINVWKIAHVVELTHPARGLLVETELVAEDLLGLLTDAGTVAALAVIAYLLAPKAQADGAIAADDA